MTTKIMKYVVFDALRSRIILAYGLLLLLITGGFVYMQYDPSKTVLSLLSIVLLIIPLVSIVLASIYFYNSREFIELTLAQPVERKKVFIAQYTGFASILAAVVMLGIGIPLMLTGAGKAGLYLLITAGMLTYIFTGLAFLASVYSNDKAKGIGVSLILWFYFSILYNALVLAILLYFSDYPLDKAVLVLSTLNPIDLSRILVMMQLDISALMGYTGALYQKFFDGMLGIGMALFFMVLWAVVPVWLAARKFKRKDF